MKYLFTYLAVVLIAFNSFSKEVEVDTFLVNKEIQINEQLKKLRAAKTDEERFLENESLREQVKSILAYPGTFDYPFESFQTMSTISSPDGAFRIFNWNIENNSGLNSHFCFLVSPSRGGKPNNVVEFKEDRLTIPPRPENTLTPEHWYGALYYNIVPVKKGNKTYYTMIGYNGGSKSTNKKILDVFYFKGKKIRMGYPIFQESKGSGRLLRRVFFEYSEKVTIGVNMNDQLDAIVFDHLIPETPNLEGMYDFYVPDMTYDAYRWQGTMWQYEEDLVAVNKENRKIRQYRPGTEEEDGEYVEVRDEWINPVDVNNPVGTGGSAIAPLEESDQDKKKKKSARKSRKKKKGGLFKRKNRPRSAITG